MNIEINNIRKVFDDKVIFHEYSTVITAHRFTCVLGMSGCGKTTLLNLLMGLMQPDSGTITGVPAKKSAVFQEDRLCEEFSAVANVRLVCQKSVNPLDIEAHLKQIGLAGSLHIPVNQLSGGMRRRVAIVRAMLADSDIIFLDEPFKGLDAETKQSVMAYVKANTLGKTVIMVTHDPEEVNMMNGETKYLL